MEKREKIIVNYSGEWKVNPYPGLLLTIDGLDGSGKGTQIDNLAAAPKTNGLRTFGNTKR